jgi:hypothetical protein
MSDGVVAVGHNMSVDGKIIDSDNYPQRETAEQTVQALAVGVWSMIALAEVRRSRDVARKLVATALDPSVKRKLDQAISGLAARAAS